MLHLGMIHSGTTSSAVNDHQFGSLGYPTTAENRTRNGGRPL